MKYNECEIGQKVIVVSHNRFPKILIGKTGKIVHKLSQNNLIENIGIDFDEEIHGSEGFAITWKLHDGILPELTGRYLRASDIELCNPMNVELI